MTEPVLVEKDGGVAVVTMNLPEKRNALTRDLYVGLVRALEGLQEDADCRAVVLTGRGGFCSGGDVGGLDDPALRFRRDMAFGHRMIRAVVGGRLPVVAAVDGAAFGAGFSLALACDFVVADSRSVFCAAFGRVGLMPDYGLLWSLPQRVGIGAAREILMLCEPIPGPRAHALGVADILAEDGAVLDAALERARKLAKASPGSLATTKAVLARHPLSLDHSLAWEADTQTLLVGSRDFQEGVAAFREKRAPDFQDR